MYIEKKNSDLIGFRPRSMLHGFLCGKIDPQIPCLESQARLTLADS
jgi:hypothetical protein